nr:folate hydrolase [Blastocatellia bacterium]
MLHKSLCRALAVLTLTGSIFAQVAQVATPRTDRLIGFSTDSSIVQRNLESQFDSTLKPGNLHDWMKRLSARPHHLGSPYNKENADFIAAQFRSWGYETKLEEFHVLFPTPKTRIVEMTAPESFKLK